jgi:hypothetical protein
MATAEERGAYRLQRTSDSAPPSVAKHRRCLCSRGASAARIDKRRIRAGHNHLKNPEKPIRNTVRASTRVIYEDRFVAVPLLLTIHNARPSTCEYNADEQLHENKIGVLLILLF